MGGGGKNTVWFRRRSGSSKLCVVFALVFAQLALECFVFKKREEIKPAHSSSPEKMLAPAFQEARLVFLPIGLKSLYFPV